jgi:large subunit ribosomal protein L15
VNLSQLRPPAGAKRERKRVGRGNASGTGTYAGKGIKGQQARSGPGPFPGFEGGQWPLVRKMARKRGFTRPMKVYYEEVKLSDLARFDAGATVDVAALVAAGIVKRPARPVKVLASGTLDRALTVRAHAFSAAARAAIEAVGGRVEPIGAAAAAPEG